MIREILAHEQPAEAGTWFGQVPLGLAVDHQAAPASDGFRRIGLALLASDAVCGIGAVLVMHGMAAGKTSSLELVAAVAASAAVWISVFHMFGMYRVRHMSAWDEFRGTISASAVGLLLMIVATPWWDRPLTRSALAWTALLVLASELLVRRLFRWLVSERERRGHLALRTALIGANGEAHSLAHALARHGRGFLPVGYIATQGVSSDGDGMPVLGDLDSLEDLIRLYRLQCVVVAPTAASPKDMLTVAQACRRAGIEMKVSANLPDALSSRVSVQRIGDVMALTLRPVRFSGPQAMLKRSFDLLVACMALMLGLPFMALIALAVRISSRGPVLFRQTRVSKGGRSFTMYKFRTMVEHPERALDGAVIDLTKPFFKLKDDPRLTSVGRLLRKLSLDELPQLWNVIVGDMSLIGPRPLPVEQVKANADFLAPRHEVRAGLTGWWQISGRSDVESEEALRLDLFYIENWSLSLDIYILLRTLGTVLRRSGAW